MDLDHSPDVRRQYHRWLLHPFSSVAFAVASSSYSADMPFAFVAFGLVSFEPKDSFVPFDSYCSFLLLLLRLASWDYSSSQVLRVDRSWLRAIWVHLT